MPLQFLPLQQRQKQTGQPLRSPISEALTPRRTAGVTGGATPSGKGFMEKAEERQALEDERKFQEKMMKLQHEQGMEKMKFAANIEEDAKKGMTAGQVLGQEPTAAAPAEALTKENMPEAAMQVWEFISTLEPESQKFFIQQLKQKEEPAGYIEAAGKRVEVPGSVGMYRYLVDQGLLDPATDTVIEKGREFEKGTFVLQPDGSAFNTATGISVGGKGDIPPDWGETYTETLTEGLKYIGEMFDASWMQTMSTEDMEKYIVTKKAAYRDWIASRLFSKGMTDKAEINRLADLAVGSYKWEKHIGEAKAREEGTTTPPTATNRDLPYNEQSVIGLREVFAAHPEALDDLDSYRDEWGDANVDAALKEETPVPTTTPTTTTPTTLSTIQKKFQKESYGKYKKL